MRLITTPILFTLLLLSAFPLHAQTPVVEKMRQYLQEGAKNGYAGSVLVASEGKILLEEGYGMADREAKRPENAETVFCIGSITKQFTAAAVLKLMTTGKLALNDPLARFFPDAPADKAPITLHQLLTHTAGFPDAIGDDYDTINTDAFVRLAFATPLTNQPGAKYQYSNVGYSILGIIVEKVGGQTYDRFLHDQLWVPAGMHRTGYRLPGFQSKDLAVGYRNNQRWGNASEHPWLPEGPGWHLRANGGVLSTTGDMYRWYLALRNHTVLPKAAVDLLFSPYVAEDPEGHSHYGYGWVVQTVEGKRAIWHNGGNGVFNAFMGFFPDSDECIVVSSNNNAVISDRIALQLHRILLHPEDPVQSLQVTQNNEEDEPYLNNPVTNAIYKVITERGADYFRQNSRRILQDAGFDFDNDMQLLGVGQRLEEAGKWDEGIALFECYTGLFPRIVVAWNRLGKCREAKGDRAGARAAWEKSVELRPNNNPAAAWLKG